MLARDAAWRCGSQRATARASRPHGRAAAAAPSTATAAAPAGDHYSVLGLSYDADRAAIRAAFRERARILHPDVRDGDDAAFRTLKRAHEVLSDGLLRAAYDAQLQDSLAGAGSSEAASALRARDPRFARFERWRREVLPDANEQLDVWTQEVTQLLSTADATLALQEASFQQLLMQGTPSSSVSGSSWSGSYDEPGAERQRRSRALLQAMQSTLADAAANVQRLYDKRYEQMQTRWPAYPDLVWYDRWLEVGDGWLDASGALVRKWQPRVATVRQWVGGDDGDDGDDGSSSRAG